ncbi:MAG: cytidylyltransferase domain-containing protein [Bacteroidota bacterium]
MNETLYKGKKIVGLVTARANSKRIPNKNLQELNGMPLISHSIIKAKKTGCFTDIYISSENQEILETGHRFGAKKLIRPEKLSRDEILHPELLVFCSKQLNFDFDMLVLLQPTSPLRKVNTIKEAIDKFIENWNEYDSLVPIYPFNEKTGHIKNNKYIFGISNSIRSQDVDTVYVECGHIFIYKKNLLKNAKNIYGRNVYPFIIRDFWERIDIDTEEDLNLARLYMDDKNGKE